MFGQNTYINSAIALSTTLALGISVTLPAAAQSRFMDVSSDYWANPYVQALTEAKIIRVFPDSTFRPDQEMTRAQFAAILSGGFPKDAVRDPIEFSDVPADHWGRRCHCLRLFERIPQRLSRRHFWV